MGANQTSGFRGEAVANTLPTKYRGDQHEGTDTLVAQTLVVGGRDKGAGDSYDNTPVVIGFNATQDPIHDSGRMGALSDQGAAVLAFRKAQKAHHAEDGERWEEADASGTITGHSTTTGEIALAAIPRRLTPRECERLQGWPDDWTRWGRTPEGEVKELSDSARYRMAGNGVSKPPAEWIARRIVGAA